MNQMPGGPQGMGGNQDMQRMMQHHTNPGQMNQQQALMQQQQRYQAMLQQQQQQQHQQQLIQQQQQQQQPMQASINSPTQLDVDQPRNSDFHASNANASPFSLDAANAAKQMAAMQAAGRSRAMSVLSAAQGFPIQGGRPATSSGANPGGPPANAPQQMDGMNNSTVQQQQQQQQQRAMLNSLVNNRPTGFLSALANFMVRTNQPLPPSVTGIPTPQYDPATSSFRMLQGGPVPGSVKIAGKDIDLHTFLVFMIQRGGGAKCDVAAWEAFANHAGLPLFTPNQNSGQPDMPTASVLQFYYSKILQPFEPQWISLLTQMRQQQAAIHQATTANGGQQPTPQQVAAAQAQMFANSNANSHGFAGMPSLAQNQQQASQQAMQQQQHNLAHQTLPSQQQQPTFQPQKQESVPPLSSTYPQISPQRSAFQQSSPIQQQQVPQLSSMSTSSAPVSSPDPMGTPGGDGTDSEGRKRKRTSVEPKDGKRSRLSETADDLAPGMADHSQTLPSGTPIAARNESPTRTQPATTPNQPQPTVAQRLKIEYQPLSRPLHTYGGRNFQSLEQQREMAQARRMIRNIDEWGEVEIETIIMSLRSRLAVEMSYALTTLTILSTITFPAGHGLPLKLCEDLTLVLVDLLEETAFPDSGPEKPQQPKPTSKASRRPQTQQDLSREALEQSSELFSSIREAKDPRRFGGDPTRGPRERAADLVLTILNIIRNFCMFPENQEYIADNPQFVDVMMRICGLSSRSLRIEAESPVLTLVDLLRVHDDALTIIATIAGSLNLSTLQPQTPTRIFRLIASYINSPNVAASPSDSVNVDMRQQPNPMPPAIPDLALEALSRIAQPDDHRKLLGQTVPEEELFAVFQSLVHMMPISIDDYTIMVMSPNVLEPWVGYAEKIVLSVYALAFLAAPALKRRMRKFPGFVSVLMRLIRFYMKGVRPDGAKFVQAHSLEKNGFAIICRRGMETLRILDDGDDLFAEGLDDIGPTFGIGFREHTTHRSRGTASSALGSIEAGGGEEFGLLAGGFEDIFEKMMCKEGMDEVLFGDMESLIRIGNI